MDQKLDLETLKTKTFFELYNLAQKFGLTKEMEKVNSQGDCVDLLWNLIKPKKGGNIFEVLNNSQKTYIKAKETMRKFIGELKMRMMKIPKDFTTSSLKNHINECEKILEELKDNNTEILVFGETSSGKSLFLNLLMGDSVLTSTPLNCTSAITVVKYDKNRRIRARKTNIKKLEDKELKIVQEENEHVKEENINEEMLLNKVESKPEKKEKIEQKKKSQREWDEKDLTNVPELGESLKEFLKARAEKRNCPLYDLVELHYNSDLLESGITLIDTPGLNENENLTGMVSKYLPKTTGVICIVNAGQGATQSLKNFLAEVAKQPNFSPSQMFVVVTHWDLFEKESDKKEFLEKMELDIRSAISNFDPKNVVKVNLKIAFNACLSKVENKDYTTLMDNLVPFFKRAFKLKLQKQWNVLKKSLIFTNNTIRVIYNKTQDIIDKNSQELTTLMTELEKFESNGEKIFSNLEEFVEQKIKQVREDVKKAVLQDDVKNLLFDLISKEPIPEEETRAPFLEAWLDKIIRSKLIRFIGEDQEICNLFKKTQEATNKSAVDVFGKVLFDLNTFEQQIMGQKENQNDPSNNLPQNSSVTENVKYESVDSFYGLGTGEKIGLVLAAPLWVPLVVAGGIIASPYFAITMLAKKIRNSKELGFIKNKTKEWKKDRFEKFWNEDGVGPIVGVFVISCKKIIYKRNEEMKLFVKDKMRSTRELLEVLEKQKTQLHEFGNIFLELKKDFDIFAENIYKFYLFNVKNFSLRNKNIKIEENNEKKVIGSGNFTFFKGSLNFDNKSFPVAVKEINILDIQEDKNSGKILIRDFISEEDAILNLRCENIIKYYGCFMRKEDKKITSLNFVYDLADTNLELMISNSKEKDYENSLVYSVSKDIANALNYVHGLNWIYRNMKPSNVLMKNGKAMLTDLGFCKPMESITGTIIGTPLYMAPEVYTGQYKNRVDQWSFGIIIFELMNRGFNNDSFEKKVSTETLEKGLKLILPLSWNEQFSQIISECNQLESKKRPLWSKIFELLGKIN